MRTLLPNWLVGAFGGFVVGYFADIGLITLGVDPFGPGVGPVVVGFIGAACGGMLGTMLRRPESRAAAVARWCLGMAALIGGVGFLAGFAGPILLTPDLPQGPLLGFFITGPLGVVLGAVLGLVLGALQGRRSV
jgi:hypothetical protein